MMKKILFIFLIVIVFLFLNGCSKPQEQPEQKNAECSTDTDCVKDSCCHAKNCVPKEKAPNCTGIFCTMECVPGTLDCGQGSCKCMNNKCEATLAGEDKITGSPVIIKQSGGSGLLIKECSEKSYITETSDYIIEGTVKKVESKWNEGKTSIFTYSDFLIERYIKGTPFEENKIQIITPGGTVGEISQEVEDQPIFHEGKRARIYFKKTDNEFSIVCGKFGVEDSEGNEGYRIIESK